MEPTFYSSQGASNCLGPALHEDKQKAILDFARVCSALSVLGVSNTEVKAIWSVLAAIYHLGIAGSVKADNSSTGRWQFSNPQSAHRAASLLGTTSEELSHCLFGEDNSTPHTSFPTSSPTDRLLDRDLTPLEMLEGMVVGLYGEVFNAIAALINR
uniref:Myosin motor domain-containing protein n=1 Tax=Timema tahoe TaxID=61484 RepID=A0A7R9IBI3_9NEOP|nr:unnamed protein product [Timema tahoe]